MDVARIIPDLDDDELDELVELDQEAGGSAMSTPEVVVGDAGSTEPAES
jgi:hypothetical protein